MRFGDPFLIHTRGGDPDPRGCFRVRAVDSEDAKVQGDHPVAAAVVDTLEAAAVVLDLQAPIRDPTSSR